MGLDGNLDVDIDYDWIPAVAARGFTVIVRDTKLRTKPVEAQALCQSSLSRGSPAQCPSAHQTRVSIRPSAVPIDIRVRALRISTRTDACQIDGGILGPHGNPYGHLHMT